MLQGEGNITMYIDVFMRYRMKKNIGVHLCVSELYGEINITLYCGVCEVQYD